MNSIQQNPNTKILIGVLEIVLIIIYMSDKFINKAGISLLDWLVWTVVFIADGISIAEGLRIKKNNLSNKFCSSFLINGIK